MEKMNNLTDYILDYHTGQLGDTGKARLYYELYESEEWFTHMDTFFQLQKELQKKLKEKI
jgi:hypothetical protein